MKKFAFLLALVAVFAMSMTAFAADPASDDVTAVALSGDCNLTAVPAGNVYFLSDAKSGDAVIGLKVTVAMPTSPDFRGTMTALKAGPAVGTIEVKSDDGKDGVYGVVVTIPSIDLTNTASRDMVLTVAVSNDTASQDITATLTPVKPDVTTEVVEGTKGDIELKFNVDFGASLDVKAVSTNVSADVKGGKVVLSNLAAKAGEVLSIDVTVSEDNVMSNGVKVIGFDGKDEKALSFGIVVEADANKAAADEVAKAAETDEVKLAAYQPASGTDVKITDPADNAKYVNVLSADMSGSENYVVQGKIITVDLVNSGDYTVIASVDVIKGLTSADLVSADRVLDFYKVFTFDNATVGKPQLVQAHKSGVYALGYNLVIIDDQAPDANAIKYQDGIKAGKPGLKISDATKTIYVWDGIKDGKAFDPIVAVRSKPTGGSSSSTCDAGFGLAAVAGLAVLALRKRSK